jgi:hypothetical protein
MALKIDWNKLAFDLESAAKIAGLGEASKRLLAQVIDAMSLAESNLAPAEIIDRLDNLILILTEASRENVCTNTKCPHYNKKCKMR